LWYSLRYMSFHDRELRLLYFDLYISGRCWPFLICFEGLLLKVMHALDLISWQQMLCFWS
jgi:hypothetical protein